MEQFSVASDRVVLKEPLLVEPRASKAKYGSIPGLELGSGTGENDEAVRGNNNVHRALKAV